MVSYISEPDDRLHRASVEFAKKSGVAVLKGFEGESITRWVGAGALSKEQLKQFSDIYERTK